MTRPSAMPLDRAVVRHVAHLAMLRISDEEVGCFAAQLSLILGYVGQLEELDTTGVPPTSHQFPLVNVFREDAPQPSWAPRRALGNAPERQGDLFRVPRVLDQEGA